MPCWDPARLTKRGLVLSYSLHRLQILLPLHTSTLILTTGKSSATLRPVRYLLSTGMKLSTARSWIRMVCTRCIWEKGTKRWGRYLWLSMGGGRDGWMHWSFGQKRGTGRKTTGFVSMTWLLFLSEHDRECWRFDVGKRDWFEVYVILRGFYPHDLFYRIFCYRGKFLVTRRSSCLAWTSPRVVLSRCSHAHLRPFE